MRNKLLAFIREQNMVQPGDTLVCAVSGGADSMALLWAMYLLKEKLDIRLEAAHFNHNLRGEESHRDAAFVKDFCDSHAIALHMGQGIVTAGEKGLEAAAREARYAFLRTLPGKIATAHTADDNAETMLMHLIRGTGLRGLGGIAPVRDNIIRPMLTVTRQEVLAFLAEENIPHVTDSSNETDAFLRNRIRHHVMPLLKAENPSLAENLSDTALRLRQDEQALETQAEQTGRVMELRAMPAAVRNRALRKLLLTFGVKEPEAEHVAQLSRLVFSHNPSASGAFPGGVVITRAYDVLVKAEKKAPVGKYVLRCPGVTEVPELGIRVTCGPGAGTPVFVRGGLVLRTREAGDTIRLSCGSKTLKKLFIDKKIPAMRRDRIPVIADEEGIVMIPELNLQRDTQEPANCGIRIETIERFSGC